MYRDSFGLQANKYINNTCAFFKQCNFTFDALVVQLLHKHASIKFNVTCIYKHNQFPF